MLARARDLLVEVLIAPIRLYQLVHPFFFHGVCRFRPTCSQYAVEAIETHGALKGFFLSLWRILRCNPFSRGGFDPVPEKNEKRKRGNS